MTLPKSLRHHRVIVLVCTLVSLNCMAVFCDPGCGFDLSVRVVDASDQPIAGATVVDESENCCGAGNCSATTGPDGVARFDGVGTMNPSPDCSLAISKTGYQPGTKRHSFRCPKDRDVTSEVIVVLQSM